MFVLDLTTVFSVQNPQIEGTSSSTSNYTDINENTVDMEMAPTNGTKKTVNHEDSTPVCHAMPAATSGPGKPGAAASGSADEEATSEETHVAGSASEDKVKVNCQRQHTL